MVVLAVLMCVAGLALVITAFAGARRHPEWSFRYGPARWIGTLGMALMLGGLINLMIVH